MKHFRMMVTRSGYTTVSAADEDAAKVAIKALSESDFDWEPIQGGCLDNAEIVEEL